MCIVVYRWEVACVKKELMDICPNIYENVKDREVNSQTVMHEVHMWGQITMWVPPNLTEPKGSQHPV